MRLIIWTFTPLRTLPWPTFLLAGIAVMAVAIETPAMAGASATVKTSAMAGTAAMAGASATTGMLASAMAAASAVIKVSKPDICRLPSFKHLPPPSPPLYSRRTTLEADSVTAVKKGVSLFNGDATVVQGNERMVADHLKYYRSKQRVSAQGNVRLATSDIQVKGDHGHYSLDSSRGEFFNAKFRMPKIHGRGKAKKIKLTGPGLSTLYQVTYTTCPLGQHDWVLKSPEIELDRNDDEGTAYNATIWLYGVPIFYTPYISFPLSDQRKTGFLSPLFSYSKHDGIDITLPYYFNIAPNMDATLTARILGRRGVLLTGQFRYLTLSSKGGLDYSLMPYDHLAHEQRSHFHFGDSSRINKHWSFSTTLNHLSDPDYYVDFGRGPHESRQLYQQSNMRLNYGSADWSFGSMIQGFQSLTSNQPPYRKLPQLSLNWHPFSQYPRLDYGFNSTLVRFAYPGRMGATRLHVQPHLAYSFGNSAWHIEPEAKFDMTAYRLFNTSSSRPTQLSRTAPIFTLDTGIVLARNTLFGGMIETLEPRLHYVYIPYRDQSNIPLFDTGTATFNFSQLFSDNRFTGTDRLGDTNQISYALTTQFLNTATGEALLSASVGQIHYFSNRRVTLSGGSPYTRSNSDIIGEARLNVNDHWSVKTALQWSPETHQNNMASVQFQYRDGASKVVNVGYRFRRNQLEETDISAAWPITKHWQLVGRWQYSLKDQATRETFLGFQYHNCCWAFVFVNRNYLARNGRLVNAVYMELQFKGLGRLGRDIKSFIASGILGYGG